MPKQPSLNEIDSSWSGETVEVEAEVKSKSFSDGNIFLEIGDRELTVVQFDTSNRFEEGEKVEVEGTVRIYRGEMEIIADSIG